jgi:hypothetical protein
MHDVNLMHLTKTDKVTLAGLFISKFDKKALDVLGFTGMWHAFNTIGYSLGASPASIKNYRDEFDRLFPDNQRKGWDRPLKKRSEKIFENFHMFDLASFSDLIKSFLIPNYEEEKAIEEIVKPDVNESVAKRLITGKAAEEYFKINYPLISNFKDYDIKDTTNFACGFDFKLSLAEKFYCVEVKGLNSNTGNIMLTEKEYSVAHKLHERYCLFVVKNFVEKPRHQFYFNPLNCGLIFQKNERSVMQINYSTKI